MRATAAAKASVPTAAIRLISIPHTDIEWEIQQLQIGITRRAYELFEARGGEHGHDWEDWFRAESELLRPSATAISTSKQRISLRINVVGFEADEIKVSVEPQRITLLGAKRLTAQPSEYPDQTFRVVELPAEVNPDAAAIAFESGVVKIELFKVNPNDRT